MAHLKQMPLIGHGVSNLLILTRAGTLNAQQQYSKESRLINCGRQTRGYYYKMNEHKNFTDNKESR